MFWATSCWKAKIKSVFYHMVFWEVVAQHTPLNLYLICLIELERPVSQMQEGILLMRLLANILE